MNTKNKITMSGEELLTAIKGTQKAMDIFRKMGEEIMTDKSVKTINLGYSTGHKKAIELRDHFQKINPEIEIFISQVGPVMGAHMGPDCFGLAWTGKWDKAWLK